MEIAGLFDSLVESKGIYAIVMAYGVRVCVSAGVCRCMSDD